MLIRSCSTYVEPGPGGRNGRRVGQHTERTRHLGKVTAGDERRRLVADTELEAGGAPVDKLDGALGADVGDGGVDVLGDHVAAVEETAGHVLALAGVALDHLVVRLEARDGHLGDRVGLVEGLVGGNDGRVGRQGEVDTGEGDEVGLELVQVDVERAVEAQRGGDRRDDLGDQAVEVGERGGRDAEVAAADVVDAGVSADAKQCCASNTVSSRVVEDSVATATL